MLSSADQQPLPTPSERMASLSNPPPAVRPADPPSQDACAWKQALSEAIRDPKELCRVLGLPSPIGYEAAYDGFKMLVPRGFVARMRRGDPVDPLLLQVLPTGTESESSELPTDAVGDIKARREQGLLQKYQGRVLLLLSGRCAINCRYCFRRHYPYGELPRGDDAWSPALRAIKSDPSVREVILSGGDPLMLSDRRLETLIRKLAAIAHVSTLRVHTRLPIVIPARVTESLCSMFRESRLRVVFVSHINHANEIDESVAEAATKLRRVCHQMLNQAVLLRRVNDSVVALESLSNRLLEIGILPYYLHQLDLIDGVGHFKVPSGTGERLIHALRKRLPGYAVPRYVREVPGEPNKTVLA